MFSSFFLMITAQSVSDVLCDICWQYSVLQIFETLVDSPVNCCCPLSDFLIACGTQDSTIHCVDLRAPRFDH